MENRKSSGFMKGVLIGIASTAIIMVLILIGMQSSLDLSSISNLLNKESEVTDDSGQTSVVNAQVETKIKNLENIIHEKYLFDIDESQMEDGIYKGLLSSLGDPYSVYYNKEEYQALMESTSGTYCGIGVLVSQNRETGVITVVKPFEGGPGYEAGILPGDILYKVAGEEVSGIDVSKVVANIKGEEGTSVDITVYRSGEDKYIDFTLQRRSIEVPTVAHQMLEDKIGYIQITEFDSVTYDQYMEAFNDLQDQGMEGLIVDLRDNPGGLVDVTVKILDEMLPEGKIVYTEDKNGDGNTWTSDAEHSFDKPLVVLVNGNSASASEIFSGAVKDYGVGTLVGTKTFGKGIVQVVMGMEDGTAIKLTVSRYFTPNGICIHETGIEPDVAVELSDELKTKAVITAEEDNQLQKAIEVIKEKIGE
ncbi:MAG: S41 family peptidase [Lachnospiraceae bacterium]